ncbi:unnamed protein product [Caenorhabditis sp. 36 PRJEB53466]|nr:unnamed protein product [Caenorhabditis sp. 36 PRJEB53466]
MVSRAHSSSSSSGGTVRGQSERKNSERLKNRDEFRVLVPFNPSSERFPKLLRENRKGRQSLATMSLIQFKKALDRDLLLNDKLPKSQEFWVKKVQILKEVQKIEETLKMYSDEMSSLSAPHQMQVRVTFYTSHNPQSVLMILKSDCALDQIAEKARELFPSADYRLYYGDVNGPIYEFTSSEQVMTKIRITTFSRTPQLFVRLEQNTSYSTKKGKDRESKSSTVLKRIEQNQEQTLKSVAKLQKDFGRVAVLEKIVAELQKKGEETAEEQTQTKRFKPVKHSATCDACLGDIIGHRYKCLQCPDFDLCEACEKKSLHYEHAMVRLVCPRKTSIPQYITGNAPDGVFPKYMRTHTIEIDIPLMIPTEPKATDSDAPKDPREENRAVFNNSATILKDTFQALSKSFLDLADGAQTGMEKKIFERSKVEAGMAKVGEKMEVLKRHCEEACFGPVVPEPEKKVETDKKDEEPMEKITKPLLPENGWNVDLKQKKTKKRAFKKTAEKFSSSLVMAAFAREEAKKRADASTAELQRKLEKLNVNEAEKKAQQARVQPETGLPPFDHFGNFGSFGAVPKITDNESLDALMRAILNTPTFALADAPAAPATPPVVPFASTAPTVSTTSTDSTAPFVETTRVSPMNSVLPALSTMNPTCRTLEELLVFSPIPRQLSEVVPATTENDECTVSIHSSFENISSDFDESLDSWDANAVVETPSPVLVEDNTDSLETMEMEEEVEQAEPAQPAAVPTAPVCNNAFEKTFDHLLEMGFDYNVVVDVVKKEGSDLEKCLAALF